MLLNLPCALVLNRIHPNMSRSVIVNLYVDIAIFFSYKFKNCCQASKQAPPSSQLHLSEFNSFCASGK